MGARPMANRIRSVLARHSRHVALVIVCAATVSVASAQSDTATMSVPSGSAGSFYDYSNLGGIPMYVNIWGFVRSPGRYKVPSSTTLADLISLAGGPIEGAFMDLVTVTRDPDVDSSLRSSPVVTYDLNRFRQTGAKIDNPILFPSSTIYVPGESNPTDFQDTLAIVASAATIVLSVIGIFVALRQN